MKFLFMQQCPLLCEQRVATAEDIDLVLKTGLLSQRKWSHSYFAKRKINHINFCHTNNCWWQTWEIDPAINIVNIIKEKYNINCINTYGLSHGGVGALLFSKELSATNCLAFSPSSACFDELGKPCIKIAVCDNARTGA